MNSDLSSNGFELRLMDRILIFKTRPILYIHRSISTF